jgi:hypothetical protein
MKTAWPLTPCVCLCIVLAGCGRNYSGPQRFPLAGRVTYDGEPIDLGSISFLPLDKDQRVSGGTITDGTYSVPEERGAHAGKYRIEIRWQKRTGRTIKLPWGEDEERAEGLPPRFHKDSTLTGEVSASQTTFDFHLESRKDDARTVGKPARRGTSAPYP